MKTITRDHAVAMFSALEKMTLSNMEDSILEPTIANIAILRKVNEDYEALKNELFKRLYGDVETMEEDARKRLQDFFDMLGKMGKVRGTEYEALDLACKETYPELYVIRIKEVKVISNLLNKELELDFTEVDEKAFTMALVKNNDKVKATGVHQLFAPFFAPEEKTTDFSELDTLL